MDWNAAKDLFLSGIAGYLALQAREMAKSIAELNVKIAVLIADQTHQNDRIKRLEDRNP